VVEIGTSISGTRGAGAGIAVGTAEIASTNPRAIDLMPVNTT
jgi:hypothetical protein